MPPRPMRPSTAYLPMYFCRAGATGWGEGLTAGIRGSPRRSVQVESDEQDRDVVVAATRVRAVDERPGRLLHVALGLVEDRVDLVVGQHPGEPVRAELQRVAVLHGVQLHVDLQVGLATQGAGDDVA